MSKLLRRGYYVFLAAFVVGMTHAFWERDPLAALRPFWNGAANEVRALAGEWLFWTILIWLCVEIIAPLVSRWTDRASR